MKDSLTFKIPFYDVDPMLVVWHGNYVKYMEQGRCALLEKIHLTYTDMANLGYAFPVVSLKIKYAHPCVFGQEVVLKTTLHPCDNCLIFKYVLEDKQTHQKLMKAETWQMAVDMKTKKGLLLLPEVCLSRLNQREQSKEPAHLQATEQGTKAVHLTTAGKSEESAHLNVTDEAKEPAHLNETAYSKGGKSSI